MFSLPELEIPTRRLNLPNQITVARLGLALAVFVLVSVKWYVLTIPAFLLAAATDWIDGFLARRYGMVTRLGRILDPFADKILVCGMFVFLAAEPESQIYAWMAVVVVGRELLVTALRSFLEQQGADFSAVWSGKLKMLLQCAAILSSLGLLAQGSTARGWLVAVVQAASWLAILITLYSGWIYVRRAVRLAR